MKNFVLPRGWRTLCLGSILAVSLAAPGVALAAGDVVFAVGQAFETLDPYNTNSTGTQSAGRAYYEGLYGFNQDLVLVPLLAESHEVSSDGLVYTFKLRQGVKFHDGTDFNADAVKVNFDRASNRDNRLARYNQFNRIAKTEVVDPTTVKVTLTEPFSPFINAIGHPSAMMISPAALQKFGKDIGFNPVGTGPFQFVEWKQTDYLKVKKFDGYWRKGYPKVDTLTFRPVPDANTRTAMVQTGEAHFAFPVPFERAQQLKDEGKVDVIDAPSISVRYVSMNVLQKPFDDVRVRHAINYAVNKEAFGKVVYAGHAQLMDGVVPKGVDFAHVSGPWPYNPAKARELLKEAGYPNGFEASLWSAYNDSTSAKSVQFLQQQLAQVGIKASLEILEPGQRVQRVSQAPDPKQAGVRMLYATWSASTGEADWALRPLLASEAWPPQLNNTAYYKNDVVDANIAKALRVTKREEKAEIYKIVQEQIWKDAPWVFLNTANNVYLRNKKLSGVYVMPDNGLSYADIEMK
ncbi:MAG: glutathione ABC transporter substrate-binding protein GsiB [Proteobacteria bacterium]|nr:glutathione ABC transporter substrate-binding protein GsiB [Pseudomonadota bacterium]